MSFPTSFSPINPSSKQYQKSEMSYQALAEKEPLLANEEKEHSLLDEKKEASFSSNEKKAHKNYAQGTLQGFWRALAAPLCCFPTKRIKAEESLSQLIESLEKKVSEYGATSPDNVARVNQSVSALTQRIDKLKGYGNVLAQDAQQQMIKSCQIINKLFHSDLPMQELHDDVYALLGHFKHISIALAEHTEDIRYAAVITALIRKLENSEHPVEIENLGLYIDHQFSKESPAHNIEDLINTVFYHYNTGKIFEIRFPRFEKLPESPDSEDSPIPWIYADTLRDVLAGKEIWSMYWSGCSINNYVAPAISQCWVKFVGGDFPLKIENLKVVHIDQNEIDSNGMFWFLQNMPYSDLRELNLSGSKLSEAEKLDLEQKKPFYNSKVNERWERIEEIAVTF